MSRERVRSFVPDDFDLEGDLADQLSSRSGSQRFIEGEHEALIIVHEVPKAGIPERDALVFWRNQGGEWLGPDEASGLRSLSSLLTRYQDVIDTYEATIDNTDAIGEVFAIIRHAGPISRSIRNTVAVLNSAVRADEDDRVLLGLRDRAREIQRAAELLFQDSKLTLDFWQAERAEEHQEAAERLNHIAFRLNLMAGFFLPLVAVAGLLGMNVRIPEFLLPCFWVILSVGLVLGVFVLVMVAWEGLKKQKR